MIKNIPLGKAKVFKRGNSGGVVLSKTILNIIETEIGDGVELFYNVENRQLIFQLPFVEVVQHKQNST